MAISSFEKRTRLQVTVHDLDGSLWPFLLPERFRHRTPCCIAVKATHDWACADFEITRLRREIDRFPEGRCHACHAGFVEWVVPASREGRLRWILFAGQRRAAGAISGLVRDARIVPSAPRPGTGPATVGKEEAEELLELLRQLRARLAEWHLQAAPFLRGPAEGAAVASRRLQIQRFVQQYHAGPVPVRDLARELNLTESRTSHLVRELFGTSYLKMLTEARLRTAASLLRETALPVLEVGLNSGFQDPSRFHRAFRRRFAMSPGRYRAAPPA